MHHHHPSDAPAVLAPRPRPELMELPEYRAGRPAPVVRGLAPLKLSSNESTHDLDEATRSELLAGFEFNRYPDPLTTELRASISERTGVPVDRIVTESGSLGALRLLLDVIVPRVGERADVVYPWRSFEAYPILTEVAGARGVAVPLGPAGANDLEAMAAAITDRTAAVLICTPNNPTGPVVTSAAFDRFMRSVPSDVLVVVDEAYGEFVDDPAALDGLSAFRAYPNVAVMRTFSKAYGLAGLRVGYAVVAPVIAAAMWRVRPTFAVTALAEHAAVRALDDRAGLAARVAEVRAGRRAVLDALRAAGESPADSQSNFVWFEPEDPGGFEERASAAAISVRRLGSGIRITIGDAAATERVLDVISRERAALR